MKTIKTILLGSALMFFASSAITATAAEEDTNAIATQNEAVSQKTDGDGRKHRAGKHKRHKNDNDKKHKHKRHKKHHKDNDGEEQKHKRHKKHHKNHDGEEQKHKRHKKHHKNGDNMDRKNHERHDKHRVSPKSQPAEQSMDSSEASN